MVRLANSGSHNRIRQPHFEDKRRRHRNADCKYRSKVQYLYFKIRSLIKKKTAKDGLLDNALGLIQNLESEIYQALGSDYMESCRKEFLSFLEKEETLWKKEKDVTKWWSNIEDLLGKKQQPLDLRVKESTIAIESEVVDKNDSDQHAKSSKRPYLRSLISSKKQKNKNDLKFVKCCCSANECGSVSYNEGFQRDIDTYSKKEDSLSSTSWNVPEATDFSPGFENCKVDLAAFKSSSFEEASLKDSTSLKCKAIFNKEVTLGASSIPMPIRNCMIDTLENTKSRPYYLGRSYVEL